MIVLLFSAAPDLYFVFGAHGREAAVPSGPAEAGQKLVLEARRVVGD